MLLPAYSPGLAARAMMPAAKEAAMLINCSAYQDGRKLADIGKAEIHEYLARPGNSL